MPEHHVLYADLASIPSSEGIASSWGLPILRIPGEMTACRILMVDAWIVLSRGLLQGISLRKTTLPVLGLPQANSHSGEKLHYEANMVTFGLSYHF